MKVLDVESLQADIAETMADIETKHTQIEAVQRAVRDFHSLDGALEGQGGDAIRGFYKDTHEPFLIHLHQTLTNYKQALKVTSEAIHSFESDSDGYVSQEFLLKDVKEGYDTAGKTAKAFTNEANQIINSVQDIVSIKEIDETEMMDSVSKGKEQVDTISEEFIEVDKEGASRLEETQNDLKTMQTFLSEMSTKFDSSASISNYSVASIRDMTSIKTIRDGVYNERVENISKKLMKGELLNFEEREILYQHIQGSLTEEDHQHMAELSLKIDNEAELKNYVNSKVLYSEADLENEITFLEKYLYRGNVRPENLSGEVEDRAKLRSYLDILKNYQVAIYEVKEKENLDWSHHSKNDPLLARVEFIRYESKLDSQANNYGHMESDITIDYHQDMGENGSKMREEYLNGWDATGRVNYSEVEYYMGVEAIGAIIGKEKIEAQDTYNNMNNEFYGEKLLGVALSNANLGTNIAYEVKDFLDYEEKKEQQNHIMNLKDTEDIAFNLAVEMKVNKRDVPRTWDGKDRQIEVHPTNETFERIRRWEAIHEQVPDAIPFDAKAAEDQNWTKLNQVFHEIDSAEYREYYEFITQRYTSKNIMIEEIDDELYD